MDRQVSYREGKNDNLSIESKLALDQLFETYDEDRNGTLDADELGNILRMVGMNPSEDDIHFLLTAFDKNGDGKLQIRELTENWLTLVRHSVCGEEMMNAFAELDENKDGYLKMTELYHALTTRGKDPFTGPEASALLEQLQRYDTNGDGKFSYSEFVQMYIDSVVPFDKPEPNPELKQFQYKIQKS